MCELAGEGPRQDEDKVVPEESQARVGGESTIVVVVVVVDVIVAVVVVVVAALSPCATTP